MNGERTCDPYIFTHAMKYDSAIKMKGMNNMDESGEYCVKLIEPQRETSIVGSHCLSCVEIRTRENGGY